MKKILFLLIMFLQFAVFQSSLISAEQESAIEITNREARERAEQNQPAQTPPPIEQSQNNNSRVEQQKLMKALKSWNTNKIGLLGIDKQIIYKLLEKINAREIDEGEHSLDSGNIKHKYITCLHQGNTLSFAFDHENKTFRIQTRTKYNESGEGIGLIKGIIKNLTRKYGQAKKIAIQKSGIFSGRILAEWIFGNGRYSLFVFADMSEASVEYRDTFLFKRLVAYHRNQERNERYNIERRGAERAGDYNY